MVVVQVLLLKVALDHRPAPSSKGGEGALPFAGLEPGKHSSSDGGLFANRPYNFWQWRSQKPCVDAPPPPIFSCSPVLLFSCPPRFSLLTCPRYWQFLLYLTAGLLALELVLSSFPSVYPAYSALVGYVGLSVEATLPLPQIRANAQARSCRGFRPSVLVNWLAGDAMKMFWFFTSRTQIPWSFKLCGLFQATCDTILGLQYFMYGNGNGDVAVQLKERDSWPASAATTPVTDKAF